MLDHRIDRNAPLQIIAGKADDEENGFTDGNRIHFRIWRQQDGLELAVDSTAVRFPDKNSGGLIPAAGFEALGTVVVEIQQQPTAIAINEVIPEWYKLYQNYPNPFNMTTKIYYDLPEDADVILEIYDITGRLVKSLVRSRQKVGQYAVEWDGLNENGLTVVTGVYLCKMLTEHYVQTLKLILIK